MFTTLQIVLLSVIGAFALLSLIFMILFIVEITVEHKEEVPVVQSVFVNEITVKNEEPETSVDDMLAKLEEQTQEEVVVENEVIEEDVEQSTPVAEKETIVIGADSLADYKARLEKVVENEDKIDKDLAKIQKSILKYERTKRRMNRNQKMLDRRASELTNLNLVMYSVTDIKNVDEDKKTKQEELTAHIAELKASIQDAEEFVESNKEKNEHNVKMAKFLLKEKSRYNEEIVELKRLIKSIEDSTENV